MIPFDEQAVLDQLAAALLFVQSKTRDTFPLIASSQHLVRNNFHNVEGRDAYLPQEAGTTESQALAALAAFTAHVATGDSDWQTMGVQLLDALISFYYPQPLPSVVDTNTVWPNHWAITVGPDSTRGKGPYTDDPFNFGSFYLPVNFTAGVGVISSLDDGLLVADVYRVLSSDALLAYQNIYAPLTSGTEYEIDYWVSNYLLAGQNFRTTSSGERTPTGETAGTIQLTTSFSGPALIVCSIWQGLIPPNTLIEAYPTWHPITAPASEYPLASGMAIDTVWWAYDAYNLGYSLTADNRYLRARDATLFTTLVAAEVENPSFWYKADTVFDPFRVPGSQAVQVNNPNGYTAQRVTSGTFDTWLQIDVNAAPPANFPSMEIQNTIVQVEVASSSLVTVNLGTTVEGILEIVLSTSTNPSDTSQEYIAFLAIAAADLNQALNRVFTAQDFIRWPNSVAWHPTIAEDPVFTVEVGDATVSTQLGNQIFQDTSHLVVSVLMDHNTGFAGVGLNNINSLSQPTPLHYGLAGGNCTLRIKDSNNDEFTTQLPFTAGSLSSLQLSWDSLSGSVTPVGPVTEYFFFPSDQNCTLTLVFAGPLTSRERLGDLTSPITYKASVRSKERDAHSLFLGDFFPNFNPIEELRYSPGVVPFTYNATYDGMGNISRSAWVGATPYFGYQDKYHWDLWGYPLRADQVARFASEAQTAYTAQSPTLISGLASPTFIWPYWDSAPFSASGENINTFSFSGPDPNTAWGPYTYRGMRGIAESLQIDPSDQNAVKVITQFLRFIRSWYETSLTGNQPITDIPPLSDPEVNYHEPHAAALIGITALFANIAGVSPADSYFVIEESWKYILSQFVDSGEMAGSWAAGQPAFSVGQTEYREFFGFWEFEIIYFLALLIINKDRISDEETLMVGIFPDVAAGKARLVSPEERPLTKNYASDGTPQFVSYTDSGYGAVIQVSYPKLEIAEAELLRDFYLAQRGANTAFTISNTILSQLMPSAIADIVNPLDQLWRFTEPLSLEPIAHGVQVYTASFDIESLEAGSTNTVSNIEEAFWRYAGYQEGLEPLPSVSEYEWIVDLSDVPTFGANAIVASSTVDQSVKLQSIIDQVEDLYPNRNYSRMLKLVLPSGTVRIENQIILHTSFVTLAGQGMSGGTTILFQPNLDTRYDVDLSGSGSNDGEGFDLGLMTHGESNGGWMFPGRACFRVQSNKVHSRYTNEFNSAPANRKDFYYGSLNFPWRSGQIVRQFPAYAAVEGSQVIPLENDPVGIYEGSYILLYAANTTTWYNDHEVTNVANHRNVPVIRTRVYRVVGINLATKTLTLDRPLEFDVPANQESDGDAMLSGSQDSSYFSNVVPLDAVLGTGIEDLEITQPMANVPAVTGGNYNLTQAQASYNYTNLAADYALHGIVLKWVANCFVRRVATGFTGSHAIVTEFVKNIQVENCSFNGSWNKGKGGNGYVRFSKCHDSLIQDNTISGLRHFTFQWSASFNVAIRNTVDCDFNLHGGWERFNLLEDNIGTVPFEHQFGNPSAPDPADGSNWFPIWWGTGGHAGNWSSATGPRNIFFNNTFTKQLTSGGSFDSYTPYDNQAIAYAFGWNDIAQRGTNWEHLQILGIPITSWHTNEQTDFSIAENGGVNSISTSLPSLYSQSLLTPSTLPTLPDNPGPDTIPYALPGYNQHISGKASTFTLDGADVDQVSDISNLNNPLISDSGFEPTTGTLDGSTTIQFNGNARMIIPSSFAASKLAHVWLMLVKINPATSSGERILEVRFGSASYQLYVSGSSFDRLILGFFNESGSFYHGITAPENEVKKGEWISLAVGINYGTKSAHIWLDEFNQRTNSADIITPTGSLTSAFVGGRNNSTSFFTGEIAELIHYSSDLQPYYQYALMKKLKQEYNLPYNP